MAVSTEGGRSASLRAGTPSWVAIAYTVALVSVFLGERVLSTIGWLRWSFTGVGVLAIVALTGVRWMAVRATGGERRSIERALAILSTLGLVALVVYLSTAEPFDAKVGLASLSADARHRYVSLATVTWLTLLLGSLVPMLFGEGALFPMRRAERVEWRRVRDAMIAGVTLALAAVYGTLFTYTAGEADVKADYSYFHTATPSESTRKILASGTMPVRVVAFFPEVNEVGVEVAGYLRQLQDSAGKVRPEMHDRLLVPELAKDLKVTDDGVIVIEYGADRASMSIGTALEPARAKLKTLDADFQKTLLGLTRERRTAYFTTGHGELSDAQPTMENEGRTGKAIRRVVEQQNYEVRDLSAMTGLGVDVPQDAKLVIVLGPAQAFLPEEVAALARYADRGGRLFLCLDPEGKVDLAPLGAIVGLTVSHAMLANEKAHLARRHNDSDDLILATNRYSSHASISTLSRMASRPVFFVGAGSLDKEPNADARLKLDFTVRALPDTFNDENGNFHFDPPAEKRQAYALAAAVTKTLDAAKKEEMRAIVFGDADAASDAAMMSNEANVVLVADGIRWLGGEESFAGAMETTEDVRIEHTKQKDLAWFYGGIFGAPALVLGGGLLYTSRLKRGKRKKPPTTPASPGTPKPSVPERAA